MLIDAAHEEETRVVVLDGQNLEEFDIETKEKQQIRGNIYLAKVTRVEPSLQACFVDFGSPRHGFLAFSEVHPDYYQIPVADRMALIEEEEASHVDDDASDDEDENQRARRSLIRRYKIQDVLKRRQIMLVQAVKEERGNKGAALTTYLSLAGRYCVLMPNTPRGGGISRKITAAGDRKRLKSIVSQLDVPKGMGLIIRTAGAKRNKTEIKRDYEYLLRLWDNIRTKTLESVAPTLIHEEESLVKRAIRDLYNKDVGSIIIEGENAYKEAKDFVKMLIPSHARKVHQYKHSMPLFSRLGVEKMLSTIHSGVVNLKSGGYLVINQTEALVAVDVNSGKSTRERSIEQTALKTNLEAADEVARQMRLRDLAGLIVIDFIDMDESRNDRAVEKRMKEALRLDRARVQMAKISNFGLMEISRQRRRTGVLEGSSHVCDVCNGFGRVRSPSSNATQIVRDIEAQIGGHKNCEVVVRTDADTAFYLLNEKRKHIAMLEIERNIKIRIISDSTIPKAHYEIEIVSVGEETDEADFNFSFMKDNESDTSSREDDDIEENDIEEDEVEEVEETHPKNKRRKSRRRSKSRNTDIVNEGVNTEEAKAVATETKSEEVTSDGEDAPVITSEGEEARQNPRRRRGKRGGRGLYGMRARNKSNSSDNQDYNSDANSSENTASGDVQNSEGNIAKENQEIAEIVVADANSDAAMEGVKETSGENDAPKGRNRKPRQRRPRKPQNTEHHNSEVTETKSEAPAPKAEAPVASAPSPKTTATESNHSEPNNNHSENEAPAKRRTGWWARNALKLFGTSDE